MTAAVAPRIEASDERGSSPAASATPARWPWWVVLGCAGLVAYVGTMLDGHWVADDEGLLGQSAERTLLGELPHRDFAETYSGGLSVLHAWVFRVFGVDLLFLRYALLVLTAVWVPTVYACASRFLTPAGALALTALAVTWSVPNYPAAMPSWYNLFFATFGLLALFHHAESGRRRWLLAAGLCAGLSIAIKIAGLYFVAAALLYLVARNARIRLADGSDAREAGWAYQVVGFGGLACFVAALTGLVWPSMTPAHALHFVVPGVALAVVAVAVMLPAAYDCPAVRLRLLVGDLAMLTAGVVVPLVALAAPYAMSGALSALVQGIFISPTARLAEAAWPPRPLAMVLPSLGLGLLLLAVGSGMARLRWLAVAVTVVLVLAAFSSGGDGVVYWLGWLAMAQGTPLVVVAGSVLLVRRLRDSRVAEGEWLCTYATLGAAGLCSLVQYPFAAPIYFSYVAPLTMLAAAAVWRLWRSGPRVEAGAVVLAFVVFAVAWLNGRGEGAMWYGLRPRVPLVSLAIPGASLRVPEPDVLHYRAVVQELGRHARGAYTYAGPDAPEVYYLARLRNPTRALFEFMEPAAEAGPSPELLRTYGVTAIAINRRPKFSRPLAPAVQRALADEFPAAVDIGKFTVRWKP